MFKILRDKGLVSNEKSGKVQMKTFPLWGHRERADLVQHIKEHHDMLDDGICYTCHSVTRALEDVMHRNKSIKDWLVAMSNDRKYEWSNKMFTIDVGKILRENVEIGCDTQNCMNFLVFCRKKVIV